MIRWLSAAIASAPLPALALSCMPWSVELAYERAEQSEAEYVVVLGDLSFDASRLPVTDWDNQAETPPQTDIPARVSGYSLTARGFTVPFDAAVTLQVHCLGPWCSGAREGAALVFLRHKAGGYMLEQEPCRGMVFGRPTPLDIAWVKDRNGGSGDR